MTYTETYTAIHEATTVVARKRGLTPFQVRCVLTIAEHGDTTGIRTDQLSALLAADSHGNGGSSVRRALVELYRSGIASGLGVDGRSRRQGVRTLVKLTAKGEALFAELRRELEPKVAR